ncbi:MAG: AarF/ABC1/UbiB kinase family protein [Deltaproteobacteria bacterium]|nr:AarF/ABC1/UbiB kinase family protein [Deltaproteobacteria bacterium]
MNRFRYFKRYRRIIATLMRHGFGWLVVEAGLGGLVPFHWGLFGHARRQERYTGPEHLRLAFEELGTTFIKLAQILSTRPDLISPAYAEEFTKLQDQVPPLPFDQMEAVLKEELGPDYGERFAAFDPEPMASASIGQVYRAILKNGKAVIVKVQKPGVRETVDQDLAILENLIRRLSQRAEWGKTYDLEGVFEEFSFFLKNELDYVREGQNADRFRVMFRDDPRLFIPTIYWDCSTARLLVMDEVKGIKVNELSDDTSLPVSRHRLAVTAVEAVFKEIFEHGFFHADPHPGNFVIRADGSLGLMDFGLVGFLEEKERASFLRFFYALVKGEAEEMIDALWDMGITGPYATRPALKRDLNHLVFQFRESSLKELAARDMLREIMAIAYRRQLHFPADLALLFKVLAMSEGLGAMLDPEFKLFAFAEGYLREQYRALFSPGKIARQVEEDMVNLVQLGRGLPHRLSHLLQRVEQGDLQFTLKHEGLEKESEKIARALNALTVSIILTLFLIAVGIYILAGHFMGFDYIWVNILLGLMVVTGFISLKILFHFWRGR